ncbi:Retrotransposon-derived protein PEG10 [Trametes pubescens]|uniref:Retrotransposon-derived protein PEG10 n=1 Tax=Trametes pubescens TaxID=154538 RepID=A0A1M2VUI9_TRAPU|nr:Retrotransposon-derived protein PEG10 [Trametes pubescens]
MSFHGRVRAPSDDNDLEEDLSQYEPAMETDNSAAAQPPRDAAQPNPAADAGDQPGPAVSNEELSQAFLTLLASVRDLQHDSAATRNAFAATLSRLETLSAPRDSSASSAPSGSIKFRDPRIFKGKQSELETFMEEIDIAMRLQTRLREGADEVRIDYFMMYLGEQGPRKWFSALLKKNPHLRDDWVSARKAFVARYEDPDLETNYVAKLEALTQTGSFMDYANKFEEYLPFSSWGDEYAKTRFYQGLEEELAKRLAGTKRPDTVAEWIPLVHDIDKDLRVMSKARERRAKTHSKHNTGSNKNSGQSSSKPPAQNVPYVPPPAAANNDVVPMEIDAIKHGKVTPEERERRKREGLCFYCGKGAHRMTDCPNMSAERKAELKARLAAKAPGKA